MVVYELVVALLELLASHIGLGGVAIGLLAAGVVGLYYLREAAGVFVVLARYARVLSLVGGALLVVLVGGAATGAVDLGTFGQLLAQLAQELGKVIRS